MTHMTRMTHCDTSVPTVGHSFFEALVPLVIIRTSPVVAFGSQGKENEVEKSSLTSPGSRPHW